MKLVQCQMAAKRKTSHSFIIITNSKYEKKMHSIVINVPRVMKRVKNKHTKAILQVLLDKRKYDKHSQRDGH